MIHRENETVEEFLERVGEINGGGFPIHSEQTQIVSILAEILKVQEEILFTRTDESE
jgi:hypothetical protein